RRRRRRRRGPARRLRAARARRSRRGARRHAARVQPGREGDRRPGGAAVRVVIADDSLLVRKGIVTLLREAGVDVIAEASSAEELLRAIDADAPDAAIVDIRMPPSFDDEGIQAAQAIRAGHPRVAIVILSQHVDFGTAMRVLAERPERLGYLLKDRVTDVGEF